MHPRKSKIIGADEKKEEQDFFEFIGDLVSRQEIKLTPDESQYTFNNISKDFYLLNEVLLSGVRCTINGFYRLESFDLLFLKNLTCQGTSFHLDNISPFVVS
jgi:hypothetical protein